MEIEVWRHGGVRRQATEGSRSREQPSEEVVGRYDAREDSGGGCPPPKVVKPAKRRELVGFFRAQYQLSQRRSCRLAGLSRKAMRYVPVDRGDKALSKALKQLGEQYPRYGYLMLHAMLRRKGLVTNKKRTYRLYTELGMQVRTKKRKKLIRPRVPMDMPLQPNERWSLDFVSDQLSDGRRIR